MHRYLGLSSDYLNLIHSSQETDFTLKTFCSIQEHLLSLLTDLEKFPYYTFCRVSESRIFSDPTKACEIGGFVRGSTMADLDPSERPLEVLPAMFNLAVLCPTS